MKMPFSLSALFQRKTARSAEPGALRRTIFLWGLGFLAFALVCLLAADGYLFYAARTRPAGEDSENASSATLSSHELDEVLELLDRREQEFNSLLQSPAP